MFLNTNVFLQTLLCVLVFPLGSMCGVVVGVVPFGIEEVNKINNFLY